MADLDQLEQDYREAEAAWQAAYKDGFPDGNRDELAAARNEAFDAYDRAWVAAEQAHLEPSDSPEIVHNDTPGS